LNDENRGSIILLSGGLDSAVGLGAAVRNGQVLLALSFDYGQRAAAREIEAAARLAEYYAVPHRVIKLPFLGEITTGSLVNRAEPLPKVGASGLDDLDVTSKSAASVWVPNRNGLFINIAAAFAESLGAGWIVAGFNAEEAATFPDNSRTFVEAVNRCLDFSTLTGVKLTSLTMEMDKVEIVRYGRLLGVPLDYVWSCYEGGEKPCGECESCLRLARALKEAGKG